MANDKDQQKKSTSRDFPLAPTPEANKTSREQMVKQAVMQREERQRKGDRRYISKDREYAYGDDMSKYGYVRDETVAKYK